jgi:hypothetical protein
MCGFEFPSMVRDLVSFTLLCGMLLFYDFKYVVIEIVIVIVIEIVIVE